MRSRWWVVGLGVQGACSGKGDDSASADDSGGPSALYVFSTRMGTGGDAKGYLVTSSDLAAGTEPDMDAAVAIEAGAAVFAEGTDGSVYVASPTEPTIVRFQADAEGKLSEKETVSFSSLGITTAYTAAASPLFSIEKSYFVDQDQDRIVVWSPERMEVVGTIPLDDEAQGALQPLPEPTLLVFGKEIIATVGWRDAKDPTVFGPQVRMAKIDTLTDTVTSSTLEARLQQATISGKSEEGSSAWYGPSSLAAAYTLIGKGHGAAPTALRIDSDGDGFDSYYSLDLSDLVGDRPAGDFAILSDNSAAIRAWHPELVDPVDPKAWEDVLLGEPGFLWWTWRRGDPDALQIPNQQPSAGAATLLRVDDETYTTVYAPDAASTTLLWFTGQGALEPSIVCPGLVAGNAVVRIR